MIEKFKVLDLFSGLGAFSLGLERSGGFETAAFCEIDPYCRRVLAKHWPNVRQYADVRELTGDILERDGISIDAITGGFPCQDISTNGKQAGIGVNTRSGLFSEIIRLAREIRPRLIVLENVTNLLSGPGNKPGGWFGRVLGDLASIGYNAEWHCIPAGYVGAPHERDRLWIVAHTKTEQRLHKPYIGETAKRLRDHSNYWRANPWDEAYPRVRRMEDGPANRVDRTAALGNAVIPQIPELLGRAIMRAMA